MAKHINDYKLIFNWKSLHHWRAVFAFWRSSTDRREFWVVTNHHTQTTVRYWCSERRCLKIFFSRWSPSMGLLTLNINSFFLFYLISFLIILSRSTRSHPMMVPFQDFYFLLFIFPDLYDLQFFTTKSFRASGSRTFYQLKKKKLVCCFSNFLSRQLLLQKRLIFYKILPPTIKSLPGN